MTVTTSAGPLVFNVQKFSIHDGPGIRTTIFFKGCPLRCPWCHNPESQCFSAETMVDKNGKEELMGKAYTIDELVEKAAQDLIFYERSGGGVTLSGGEVMAQDMDYIVPLMKRLEEEGMRIGIDTSGAVPYERFEQVLPYTDFFLYDIKMLNRVKHKKYIGADNDLILENVKRLSDAGATIYLRLIMVGGVNMDMDQDIKPLIQWLVTNHIQAKKVHLLPYHTLGKDKYTELGREATLFTVPDRRTLQLIQDEFTAAGYTTVIGG